VECTTSGKSKGTVESNLKPTVTYRPQQMKKSTSCLGGCSERRGSAVSRFDLIRDKKKGKEVPSSLTCVY